jgi:signal transduction histidine kinase
VIAHEIRARLHAARLHLTFLQRALLGRVAEPEIVEAVTAASDELRQLQQLVLAHLALTTKADGAS